MLRADVVLASVVSCAARAAPVRTVYWLGKRILRESPIFAPDLANESSYWRLIEPMKFSFWCNTARALRVTAVGVNRVLGMMVFQK